MALTTAQLAALKADIAASEFAALPNNDDVAFAIAAAYNLDLLHAILQERYRRIAP